MNDITINYILFIFLKYRSHYSYKYSLIDLLIAAVLSALYLAAKLFFYLIIEVIRYAHGDCTVTEARKPYIAS